MDPEPASTRPSYSLPRIALGLSIAGACTCLTSLVGAILGVVALVRIHRQPELPGRGLAIAAIVVAVGLVPFQVGVLAGIALPNIIRFQARSKQTECKVNLRSLVGAQLRYRAEHGHYARTFDALGFTVPPGNRYAYLLSESEIVPVDGRYRDAPRLDPVAEARKRSLGLGASDDVFLAACIGNIDNDPTLDVWTVSSEDRPTVGGFTPSGVPRNDVNDVTQ